MPPLMHHALSYLNGVRDSGKTISVIKLFQARKPLVFMPTHCYAKGMDPHGVKAQT